MFSSMKDAPTPIHNFPNRFGNEPESLLGFFPTEASRDEIDGDCKLLVNVFLNRADGSKDFKAMTWNTSTAPSAKDFRLHILHLKYDQGEENL